MEKTSELAMLATLSETGNGISISLKVKSNDFTGEIFAWLRYAETIYLTRDVCLYILQSTYASMSAFNGIALHIFEFIPFNHFEFGSVCMYAVQE